MKLTKRQFRNRIYRRNIKLALVTCALIGGASSVEFGVSFTAILATTVLITGFVIGITTIWVVTEMDEAYKEYEDDYDKRNQH